MLPSLGSSVLDSHDTPRKKAIRFCVLVIKVASYIRASGDQSCRTPLQEHSTALSLEGLRSQSDSEFDQEKIHIVKEIVIKKVSGLVVL